MMWADPPKRTSHMTKPTDGNGPKGPKVAKPARPKANRNSVADLLSLATLDGIPVKHKGTARVVAAILKDETIQPVEYQPAKGQSPNSLTAKQESFAQHVAEGMTMSGAYRAAYNAEGMTDRCVWTQASLLASNPKVSGRIKALDNGLKPKAQHDPAEAKAKVIQTLLSILQDAKAGTAHQLRAAELLGKWGEVGLFVEQSVVRTETIEPEKALEALKDKINKLKAS